MKDMYKNGDKGAVPKKTAARAASRAQVGVMAVSQQDGVASSSFKTAVSGLKPGGGLKRSGTERWLAVVSSSSATVTSTADSPNKRSFLSSVGCSLGSLGSLGTSVSSACAIEPTDDMPSNDMPSNDNNQTTDHAPDDEPTRMNRGDGEAAPRPAVIMFQTSGCGWSVGKLSSTGVPPKVGEELRAMQAAASGTPILVSDLISMLISKGYAIVSQSSMMHQQTPELFFTLTGPSVGPSARVEIEDIDHAAALDTMPRDEGGTGMRRRRGGSAESKAHVDEGVKGSEPISNELEEYSCFDL